MIPLGGCAQAAPFEHERQAPGRRRQARQDIVTAEECARTWNEWLAELSLRMLVRSSAAAATASPYESGLVVAVIPVASSPAGIAPCAGGSIYTPTRCRACSDWRHLHDTMSKL